MSIESPFGKHQVSIESPLGEHQVSIEEALYEFEPRKLKRRHQRADPYSWEIVKSMTVERLFEPISEAIKEGITLELLCSYLQQNGIQITPSYLKNALYRIRKKKKNLHQALMKRP
ncbi:hypothetical protein PCI56_06340 [Plesiomonas shigelloides subsp. oncorhynchi]|nr:hypothetical protein [Plesiomonas shigelloides]